MITVEEAMATRTEWASFTCPSHDDTNPSARVHTPSGYWVCMSCGAKGKADQISIDLDVQLEYATSLLKREVIHRTEAELDLYDIDGPGEYWLTRFSYDACVKFRLGMDGDFPVYPIRDHRGVYLGLVRRNPYGELPKYRYPRGISTSSLLFGFEFADHGSRLVLVEGAPDVIAAYDAGVAALGTYGARLHPTQIALLQRLNPVEVVVAYDNDRAGHTGAYDAVRSLMEAGILATRIDLGEWHDVADIPLDLRRVVLEKPAHLMVPFG